jgi:DNA helicase-2/ATP-dependent DNA helicase PcrA
LCVFLCAAQGEVLNLDGVELIKKAEIKFDVGGIKKLLRFAKLDYW